MTLGLATWQYALFGALFIIIVVLLIIRKKQQEY